VIASDGDGVWREYAGGYSDMVAQKGSGVAARKISQPVSAARDKPQPAPREASGNKGLKLSFKQKHALETLPGEMAKLESEIAKLRNVLADPDLYARDRRKFDVATAALAEREAQLAQKEEMWLELEILRESAG
jgi:ATP-binding cassette subfamily F protein uup